jgi:RNA polymerase sigma-70 factor, ECF subfamily
MVWPSHAASVPDAILTNLDGLYRFACRLTKDADRAQDLIQETALRALQQEKTIVRDPRAWLFQTLYHTFISDYRRLSREAMNTPLSEEELDLQNLSAPLPDFVAMEDVKRAIEALPQELGSVVWLSVAEGFRLREIAQILGWPIGTVASRLWRARQELRILLSVYRPPEEQEYDMR